VSSFDWSDSALARYKVLDHKHSLEEYLVPKDDVVHLELWWIWSMFTLWPLGRDRWSLMTFAARYSLSRLWAGTQQYGCTVYQGPFNSCFHQAFSTPAAIGSNLCHRIHNESLSLSSILGAWSLNKVFHLPSEGEVVIQYELCTPGKVRGVLWFHASGRTRTICSGEKPYLLLHHFCKIISTD
jgi:hypothetical protein